MSQAIAYFIYGVPIIDDNDDRSEAHHRLIDDQPPGVITKYSGNGTWGNPAAFGILLSELDEGDHHDELGNLRLHATPEEVTEYQKLFAALDDEYKVAFLDLGTPRVFILWGSS